MAIARAAVTVLAATLVLVGNKVAALELPDPARSSAPDGEISPSGEIGSAEAGAAANPMSPTSTGLPGASSRDSTAMLSGLSGGGDAMLAHRVRPGEGFSATLYLEGAEFTLAMSPHSVRGAGFDCEVVEAGGSIRVREPGPVPTFRGTIREIPGSDAVAGVIGDQVEVFTLLPDGGSLWLSLVQGSASASGMAYAEIPATARMSRIPQARGREELIKIQGDSCASFGVEGTCAENGYCVADFVADTDSGYYTNFSGTPEEIETEIQATIETFLAFVNLRWEDEFSITHRLSACVIRPDSATDPYSEPPCCGTAQCTCSGGSPPECPCSSEATQNDLLDRIHDEWVMRPEPRDLVHLFSGSFWVTGALGAC